MKWRSIELQTLEELVKLFEQTEQRVRFYKRITWTSVAIGFVSFAVSLDPFDKLPPVAIFTGGVVCGICLGLGFLYYLSYRQAPLLKRFTVLKIDEVKQKISELKA